MANDTRLKASLSLDLDNQWSYMKTHGDEGWQSFPSYLDVLIPRVLSILEKHNFKITFFIVGQDAALEKNRAALAAITAAGHEVGNHSFHHEPWLHLYSDEEVEREISAAEQAIEAATGVRPSGFRGPGFSISRQVLETLKQRGYRYDASTFPTFIGPLARAYYFFSASLPAEEREKRKALFGSMAEGMRPLRPYEWELSGGPLIELPVTTTPFFRAPFHMSYVLFLAAFSPALANLYFKTALTLCRLRGIEPSLLLHPLDFLGGDDINALQFFPAMKMRGTDKLAFVDSQFAEFGRQFQVLPMGAHVSSIEQAVRLRRREPRFSERQVVLDERAEHARAKS